MDNMGNPEGADLNEIHDGAAEGRPAEGQPAEPSPELLAAEAELEAMRAQLAALETENSVLKTEKGALQKKLDAAAAEPKAKASRGKAARKIGPLKDEIGTPVELLELIQSAAKVEVAFSDGKTELAGVPAREITGDAWYVGVAGLLLRADILLDDIAAPPAEIVGYGLIVDGDLVAYRARPEPLSIGGGRMVRLTNDIVF